MFFLYHGKQFIPCKEVDLMAQIGFNASKFKNKHLLLSLHILPAFMDNIKQQLDQE